VRPLSIIFLTIFVNLVGFGIIIPLLPFYAQTFGASPLVIGLLFASFSLSQLVASPILGDLSDRWGRRPVLIFSLLGTVVSFVMLALATSLSMLFAARIVDGLSGGNITTARAYIADITTEENRAKAFGLLGAAFGLGFIVGPGLGAALSHISYTAPIWAAAVITVVATALAFFWLPETVHRAHAGGRSPWRALAELWQRAHLRVLFTIDFAYWTAFAVYQTTFALFGARRFGFDAAHTGYLLSAFGILGVVVQGAMVGPIVAMLGERRTLAVGLLFAAFGWGGSAVTHSLSVFVAMLVPGAIGIGLCNATLSSLVSKSAGSHEQGRVQGAAGGLESLGRTIGPVWGNGSLQKFGEGTAYGSAAIVLVGAAALTMAYHQPPKPETTVQL
jgi:DHA1 family tetracycline resistance protein-like MFS transporter